MIVWVMAICMTHILIGSAHAQKEVQKDTNPKDLAQIVADGCKVEINTYCIGVTPGNGRVLACLYAYQDKLSNRCEYALYDASVQLERMINTLAYLATECKADLKTYCSDIAPGQGRLMNCIERNKDKLSDRCKQAFKDTGVK